VDRKKLTVDETNCRDSSIKDYFQESMVKKIRIKSDINNLSIIENAIDSLSNETGINQDSYGRIMVSTMEAVNNAIIHGNKSDAGKYVEVRLDFEKSFLEVTVTDEGRGFKPSEVPDPTRAENIESLSGRGVFLMSKLADKIEFNRKGNSVKMIFKNTLS
jgi:serine/threonine-protein kinase RsbW